MKINLLNKIYAAVAITLVFGTIYKIVAYKSWDRYYYYSNACTPSSYPIYLRNSYFITADEDDFSWIDNEKVENFSTYWGDGSFPEVRERMRLPQKIVLQYVSYRDDKFYNDTISLPEAKIKSIFKSAKKNNQLEEIYRAGGDVKGLKFLVGISNDGNIIVWLRGKFLEEKILNIKLHDKEPRNDQMHFKEKLSKEVYLEKVFENLSDSLKNKIKSGWDSQANYIDTPTNYIDRNRERWEKNNKKNY